MSGERFENALGLFRHKALCAFVVFVAVVYVEPFDGAFFVGIVYVTAIAKQEVLVPF